MSTQNRQKKVKPTSSPPPTTVGAVTRHWVRDAVQERILTGHYPPGTRLGQMHLAREFKVAQSVVREALLELKAFGMVDLRDQLGAFVSPVDAQKLLQAHEVREVLEGLAARLCCARIGRQELLDLEGLVRQMQTLSPLPSAQRLTLDREFHRRIIVLSRSDMLIQLSESYQILGKVIQVHEDHETYPEDHGMLLEPIRANRPEEAERRMRQHIERARRDLEQKIRTGTFTPRWINQPSRQGHRP